MQWANTGKSHKIAKTSTFTLGKSTVCGNYVGYNTKLTDEPTQEICKNCLKN